MTPAERNYLYTLESVLVSLVGVRTTEASLQGQYMMEHYWRGREEDIHRSRQAVMEDDLKRGNRGDPWPLPRG